MCSALLGNLLAKVLREAADLQSPSAAITKPKPKPKPKHILTSHCHYISVQIEKFAMHLKDDGTSLFAFAKCLRILQLTAIHSLPVEEHMRSRLTEVMRTAQHEAFCTWYFLL